MPLIDSRLVVHFRAIVDNAVDKDIDDDELMKILMKTTLVDDLDSVLSSFLFFVIGQTIPFSVV